MSVNKITEKELEKVVEQQKQINDLLLSIGSFESQKHSALHKIATVNETIELTKKELEAKYGQINIDLTDGSYTKLEETKE